MEFNTNRLPSESDRQYIWRICSAKDCGTLDLPWSEVARIINIGLGKDEEEFLCESAYRKAFQTAKAYKEEVFSQMTPKSEQDRWNEQRDELYKQKRQLMDQRREYNKILTQAARAEHLHEVLREAAGKLPSLRRPDQSYWLAGATNNEGVLFLSDWHYGMVADNIWNSYNISTASLRVEDLIKQAYAILRRHEIQKLHVVILGDMVAGGIHVGCRVEAEESVCQQLMDVSEMLAETIASLAEAVPEVAVYCTYGNHARTIQNHRESVHGDNMERIIPWWLKERLAEYENIQVVEDSASIYEDLMLIEVCGYYVVASHGDLDRPRTAGTTLSTVFNKRFDINVDYVVLGHWHHSESVDTLGIDTVVVPALCGSDAYAHSKRLYSEAGQSLMVFSPERGRECVYTIRFTD